MAVMSLQGQSVFLFYCFSTICYLVALIRVKLVNIMFKCSPQSAALQMASSARSLMKTTRGLWFCSCTSAARLHSSCLVLLMVTNPRSRLSEEGLCVVASDSVHPSLLLSDGEEGHLTFPSTSARLLSVGAEWLFCFPTIMFPLTTSGVGAQGVWCS